ncbi:MAG: hypothetical protein NTX61_16695 [Bacteroidetes bacterium]|nr:hypothetical protein [Bacteroidota bacterium]
MSYGGYVKCNCYEEGKTSEPPFKEFVRIIPDYGPALKYPEHIKNTSRMNTKFMDWRSSACPHSDFNYASIRFNDFPGFESVYEYIAEKKYDEDFECVNLFPILYQYLPDGYEDKIPIIDVLPFMNELLAFQEITEKRKFVVFNGMNPDKIIAVTNYGYPRVIAYDAKYAGGIDDNGFFITKAFHGHIDRNYEMNIVFRSSFFSQSTHLVYGFVITDISTGKEFITSFHILQQIMEGNIPDIKKKLIFRVSIEEIPITRLCRDFIDSLIKLCAASLETGNPVVWY